MVFASLRNALRSPSNIVPAFVVGSAFIVCLRVLPFPGMWGALLACVAAVLVIFLHGVSRRREPNIQRVADDTYYLGLLFTLVSLIVTLVNLFLINPGGDFEAKTQSVVGNFGIALVSTVAGILGRIWLSSMVADTEESKPPGASRGETDSGASSPEEVIELRRELREATAAMRHFTRITLTEASQAKTHMERLVQVSVREMHESAQAAVQQSSEVWNKLSEDSARLQDAVLDSVTAFGLLEESLREGVERSRVYSEGLNKELQAEVVKSKRLISSAQVTGRAIDSSAKSIQDFVERLNSSGGSLRELEKVLSEVDDTLKSLGSSVARIDSQSDKAASRVSFEVGKFGELIERLGRQRQAFEDLMGRLRQSPGDG